MLPSDDYFLYNPVDRAVGDVFAHRYRIISLMVPQGQHGRVYKAFDMVRQTSVALKLLYIPHFTVQHLFRFRNVAYANANCEHPRIVKTMDFGSEQDELFVVMELLHTPSLAAYIHREQRLSPAIVEWMAYWLADALAYLHNHAILHLNLTLRNVFFDADVGIQLADAALTTIGPRLPLNTQEGLFIRDIYSLSPEQMLDQPVTPATDMYAFGVLLFKLLTDTYPYPGSTLAQRLAILRNRAIDDPPRASQLVTGVPPYLDDIVRWCLHKDDKQRPQDSLQICQYIWQAIEHR